MARFFLRILFVYRLESSAIILFVYRLESSAIILMKTYYMTSNKGIKVTQVCISLSRTIGPMTIGLMTTSLMPIGLKGHFVQRLFGLIDNSSISWLVQWSIRLII